MEIDSSNMMQLGRLQQQQAGIRRQSNSLQAKARSGRAAGSSDANTENTAKNDRLKETCSDFQAIFIKQMLDSMRKTVNKSGLLEGGQAEEIFEDMLYDEYAQSISKNGDIGLDDMLYKQLSRLN
ncbi:MAG: rod-binding protein [Spirochaetia bacterium]|nr:rod-binding protein [Spirochaetia bacterium]